MVAIVVPPIATFAFTIMIGWVFLFGGAAGLFTTFYIGRAPGFWWSLISALIGIAAGVILLARPITGALSLTLVLIAFFVVEGVASIMYAIEHRSQLIGPVGLDAGLGIVDLILAAIIFFRSAGNGGVGDRPPGRHQHAVRRLGADRHGALGAPSGVARPGERRTLASMAKCGEEPRNNRGNLPTRH